ncbi:MAG: superoxide dismutase family protein [Bacteriovoracia bacterium]
MKRLLILAVLLGSPFTFAKSEVRNVKFINARGNDVGAATFTQLKRGVLIKINLRNVEPGTHAVHIHNKGECKVPDFQSAGEHYSVSKQKHGFDVVDGPHAGDLPNIVVGSNGSVDVEIVTTGLKLKSLLKRKLGASLIVHSKVDDYKSQPAGDSGDRVACAVIKRNELVQTISSINKQVPETTRY